MTNARTVIAALVAGMVVVGGAGAAVGSRLRSPAEVAADAQPPAASVVTAPVERRQLSSSIVTRGSIRFADPIQAALAGPVGSSGSTPPASVVTTAVEQGTELAEGAVALTVAGRPVFLLQGAVPMYRSIGPGDSGDDVRQLEEALKRLGHDPGKVDGVADAGLFTAVASFYKAAGHKAQGLTDAEQTERRTLSDAVTTAEREVLTAQGALDTAGKPPSTADIAKADAAVQSAVDALDAARRKATSDQASADADVAAKQRALDDAKAAAATANTEQQKAAKAKSDAQKLSPADPAAVAEADTALTAANDKLATANRAVQNAQADLDAANRAKADVGPGSDAAIRQAATSLTVAQADRAALDAPRDTATAQTQLTAATQARDNAKANLTRFDAEHGTTVPAGEIIFVPSAPLRVDEVKVKVGDTASGPVLTLSGPRLAVDTSIAVADRELVREGVKVEVTATDFGITAFGTIDRIESKPGTNGLDKQKVYVSVVLDDAAVAADLAGAAVRVTIPVSSTAGEVLTVPVSAVVTRADGSTLVVKSDGGGSGDAATTEVPVKTGLASGGDVEVTPLTAGALAEGDRVVVNQKAPPPAGGGATGDGAATTDPPGTDPTATEPTTASTP